MKKNMKRFAAIVLVGTMVFGSALTALAEGEKTQDATGTYEGNKMAYPTLSVTLPTIPDETYNYIADPNDNLKKVENGRLGEGNTFTGNSGVYFKTEDKKYANTSAPLEVSNQNAQDIIVTATVVQKTAGKNVLYSATSDFSGDDVKDKKAIYLAIQNGAGNKVSALEKSDGKAEVAMVVKGTKANYEPKYEGGAYKYVVKTGELTWQKVVFKMTGALNKKVAWESGDGEAAITFPALTVTYSFAAVPVMTGDEATGYSYTWASGEPSGTVQSLTIDGVDRPAPVTNGKIKYDSSAKKLTLDPAPVASFGLATGSHTLVVKIGANVDTAVEYTLNIEN